jgi:serine protease Do
VTFKKKGPLAVGDAVLILGILGQSLDHRPTTFLRRVGAVLENPRMTYCIDDRVPFGAVGGPVIDELGDVIGVVGFDLSPSEGGELYVRSGHPLIYEAELFVDLIANPPGERAESLDRQDAWLGVFTQPLTDDLAEYWGLEGTGGVVVSTLVPDSPAGAAGLERGDVITAFNGVPVKAKQDREVLAFTKLVREAGVGTEVALKLIRDGEPMELTLRLAERPKSARDAGEHEDTVFGLTVREITTDVRILLNLPDDVQGVIVRRVKSGSWADLAGFRPGVIIMNFGDHPVRDLGEFVEAVEKVVQDQPSEVTVFCKVGARTGFFRIQPRWQNGEQD